jgi:hypothetical protein
VTHHLQHGRTRDGGGINSTHLPGFVGLPGATRPSLLITSFSERLANKRTSQAIASPATQTRVQQFRREAGRWTRSRGGNGRAFRRYKARFGSGFHIFLCREIAQAANHVGMEKGSKFHSGLRKLLISSLVSCRRRCATCELCFNE